MASTPVDAERADLEKRGGVGVSFQQSSSSDQSDPHSHHYGARVRERLGHFLHPNGKRIHVARSPDDAVQLRKRLAQIHPEDDFDVYITGSPEHLDALRSAQTHHEDRREVLRNTHGEMYDQFASVHNELDALYKELERVTTHGVSLEAHFSRFGYNAHVRSYDEDSPSESGTTTPRSSISGKTQTPSSERGFATTLKLFKTPTVRQYFHKGILWRASSAEEVQSFELFVDLLYVGIIAINGDYTSEDPTGLALLRFVITFTLSYKIWNDMALFISWFESDDVFTRVSVLILLACLFGYTTNITMAFEATYATLIGFYLAARLYMALYVALVAWLVPMVRGVMVYQLIVLIISSAIWVGSIHVDWPGQLGLIFAALAVDISGQFSHLFVMRFAGTISSRAKAFFEKHFEYVPAINIEHRTERTNAFVTLVFGYTVVAMLYQSTVNGIDAFYGKAILGLIQCFIFNWLYFEVDGANLQMHAIRRHKVSAMLWAMVHLPFIMCFVLGGGAMARLVVIHDTPDAKIEDLTETYQARSEGEIRTGIRWFYCAGFGLALLFMGIISMTHVHKEVEGTRLSKKLRLIGRFAVSIIMICLPLAESLDSLDLVGIMTALIVSLLALELWATSCCNERLFGRSRQCQYFGQCGKKKVRALVQDGKEFDVDTLVDDKEKHSGVTMLP